MFRPLFTIIMFLVRNKYVLEECLCKACSRVSMCLALNVVYNLGMEPSEVGSESVGGGGGL